MWEVRRPLLLLAFLAAAALAAGGASALAGPTSASRSPQASPAEGPRGPQGLRGRPGPGGEPGPAGDHGPAGAQGGPTVQAISISWANGRHAGRDSASFDVPGLGIGSVSCRPDRQLVEIVPLDRGERLVMTTVRHDDRNFSSGGGGRQVRPSAVRRADMEDPNQVAINEGFNLVEGSRQALGSFVGTIASNGRRDGSSRPRPPVTTFRLSFHWDFDDGPGSERCFVAGSLVTGR